VANKPMLNVVIDTNVFISAFYLPESRPAEVVLLARRKRVQNFISPQILKEIERIFRNKLLWDNPKTHNAIKRISEFSEMVYPQERLTVITDDPDNRILECALEAHADSIISGDHHLTQLKVFQGINILTPAAFLELIGEKL
jgi:putative PIN family toxin of toxin-antitoxin system